MSGSLSYVPADEDLPYEEDVLRSPYSLRAWLRYLEFKAMATPSIRNILYERSLKELPGSYKLWYAYLQERRLQLKGRSIVDPAYEAVNNTFERCLVYLGKMPRIWMDYCEFLIEQKRITKTRQVFDRALRALAVTQHDRIWRLYIKFVRMSMVPVSTAIRVHKRFMKWEPRHIEEFVNYLVNIGEWDEAAVHIIKIVNDPNFVSTSKKTKHDFWMTLCDIISKHSEDIKSIKVEPILRSGLSRFSDQVGRLWTTLADYYIRLANYDKARDIFEEGMNTVITVKDFTQIWDAYATFEDRLIAAQTASIDKGNSNENSAEEEEELLDFDLRIARYENLIERQPLLINSVLLRQNPHNVHEWAKRAKLCEGNPKAVVDTYRQALSTVDPQKAKGRLPILWINFARFYEDGGDIESARKIFTKAVTTSDFKFVEDLAIVWCEFVEMELRHHNYEEARQLLQNATTMPKNLGSGGGVFNEKDSVQRRVYKNAKLWSLYADVEESLGTFLSTKAVYDRMIDLKAATPQNILNYAAYLEEHKYFEESFKAYEKGIALFGFPHVFDIWVTYLTKFVTRYGGRKIERARELFEQVIESAPAKDVKVFYIMYANLEEEHGLARRAMAIYDRAAQAVPAEDKFALFSLYVARASEFFGVAKTREIYEKSIEILPDKFAVSMCLRFAALERRLGEIDRARAVFVHCSQFCDPRLENAFWNKWREFEVDHGNKDTFREMLRIKRSVQAQFANTINFLAAEMMGGTAAATNNNVNVGTTSSAVSTLQSGGTIQKFVSSNQMELLEKQMGGGRAANQVVTATSATSASNPEEISLDEDESESEGEDVQIEQMQMPQAVIDRNVGAGAGDGEKESNLQKKMGALERMKRKRELEGNQ